ncbi:MAG TPA: class I SAM-dependent methyltransferase [Planctomycetota bacterium]|nr:class I SAM-dependent methyltransferase [Planctomycetota bacterium]
MTAPVDTPAQNEDSVRKLYQSTDVATKYIQERFAWAWSRLLHETQVKVLNDLLASHRPASVLEVAPGPARIAPDLKGVARGTMVEASEPMIEVARERLRRYGLERVWNVKHGNAFDLAALGQTFDFVYTFRFLRHFEESDRRRLMAQVRTVLNASGVLVFDVVNQVIREAIDAREKRAPPQGALPVYDVTYLEPAFRAELASEGFEVVALRPAIRHYFLQSWLSYRLGTRLPKLAWMLVNSVERIPAAHPLEWVAVCRRSP